METLLIIALFFLFGFLAGRITRKKEFKDNRKLYRKTCKYCKIKFTTCYDTIDECNRCSDQGWLD